ncbi:SprT family zinc-dependent metalloprotease [Vibrio sp. SCSIO 43136]|uniref:SprT family zinc-dependent metalloprotease n=1 Tax=Vibrio sp. SCSIO 43136 TaxID=2819101 RepID=UPI002075E58D|nr:SprT family zinc-dependent metalloprotease [Vibrio sp. SCSIO 43136]USD65625.1 SprT family zinc-dependent metalloprotease [Vibrio sp. SCSIO 43136]
MPPIDLELSYTCQKVIARCIEQANHYFKQEFPQPELSFKLRGKSAGKAYLNLWQIRINPTLLKENQQAFLNEVIPHEIAHLIVYKLFGRVRPHGKEWQAVMQEVFHLAPKTTHDFDVTSVQGKTYVYQCHCQSHQLTIRRHNKVLRQQASYLCSQCKQPLIWQGS